MNIARDKTPKPEKRTRRGLGCLIALAVLIAVPWTGWTVLTHRFEMARFPDGISVEGKIYSEEKSWGFGPGGAETGLSLYELDAADAERLLQIAPSLTSDERIRAALGRKTEDRDYGEWRSTPFRPTSWPWQQQEPQLGQPYDIDIKLGSGSAFPIDLDPDIAQRVNDILNSPGAYYATGGGSSLIIVAPQEALVIYAFKG